jgi:dTDP-4-dehydrorhamnose reductase
MLLELLLEHDYRGVLHTTGATVIGRIPFTEQLARRFGLSGEIIPVKTAEVKLPAPRPLRGGLRVERAAALLRHRPLSLDDALDLFHAEWMSRGAG